MILQRLFYVLFMSCIIRQMRSIVMWCSLSPLASFGHAENLNPQSVPKIHNTHISWVYVAALQEGSMVLATNALLANMGRMLNEFISPSDIIQHSVCVCYSDFDWLNCTDPLCMFVHVWPCSLALHPPHVCCKYVPVRPKSFAGLVILTGWPNPSMCDRAITPIFILFETGY